MIYRNKKIVICTFILIGFVFYLCSDSLASSEIKKDNQKSIIWTETLSLQDFFLSPDYIEVMSRLKEYKTSLAKEYKENPSVFSTAISYGLLLIDLGELEKAKLVWEKALKDFHANEAPKAYKAWLDARLGNYQEAKDTWELIVKQKIDNGTVGFGSGIWLLHHTYSVLGLYLIKDFLPEDQREEVSKVIDSIVRAFPQNPKFAAVLINEYFKSGEIEKAAKILAGALNNNSNDPVLITLLGIAQLMTNHYDEALKLLDRAKGINPNILTNRVMRARVLFALNKEKEAFEELNEAMKLNPDLNITESNKKKYLTAKNYMISKKLKKEKVPQG